jgi:uncharacterized protein (TIGR00269 family)
MRCRTCGTKAVINMRQHKLGLCKTHFLEWLPVQTARFIKKYEMFTRYEKVLIAVSGGKDSLSLWDILINLGYHVDGLYINLGIGEEGGYSDRSISYCEKFALERNQSLHVVDVKKEYGETIPQMALRSRRGRGKPCSVCGLTKRYVMNRMAKEHGYNVLATGHNLDDETAVLFGNTIHWAGEFMLRQAPVLPFDSGLMRKAKPLCRFYEKEMAAYAFLKGLAYIYDECPFSIGSTSIYYKQQLNRLEHDNPGEKLRFYLHFLKAKENGLFAPLEKVKQELTDCIHCRQPTSAEGICSFCRMLAQKDQIKQSVLDLE